ncbi:hypothetical protein DDR33_20770 [Pararcticibacter amylolyticus]|uniref:Glycosyltransferase RgtA/B/C/D-like domain-containing protein n=2 Tax=Pararcticibacter amylolyticus TaxID=2173175 RepID=A0A2U2PBI8_9SPHI|nr:hypothetical protein DDR33_20770 [Pararcticibacter amylolyticus]
MVFFLLLLIAIPAFFTNLGLLPLFADEPTRANVAMEMILTKNYSVPTIGGEYYYNKPPLYNWILAGLYALTGSYSEFVTRLPAVVPMFLFAVTIFYAVAFFIRDKRVALLSGLAFLVNGRMLLYDSMLGHIDIFYSWLTFISFMSIFYFFRKKQWFLLFFVSYLITAVTFLSKGLPSIVFQGMTIIALLLYTRNFRRFFSWQHILSGIICLLIIGAYFFNYYHHNPDLKEYFHVIWDQSSQRTIARSGFIHSFGHLFTFPFEHLVHLLPVSLLVIFCLNKKFLKNVREDEFIKYISVVFLANIWVYWLSPETRPRYLLMLYPLLFIVLSNGYYMFREQYPRLNTIFNKVLLMLAVLVTLAVPSVFFIKFPQPVSFVMLKVLVLLAACGFFTFLIYSLRQNKIVPFIALLLMVRLAFSWFVLPSRLAKAEHMRTVSIDMAEQSKGSPFFLYQYHPEVLSLPYHHKIIYYLQRTKKQQVRFTEEDTKQGYYLTFDRDLQNPRAVLVKTYEDNLKLYRVQ